MTTELEEQFFKVFGVARQHLLNVNTNQEKDEIRGILNER